MEEYDNVKNETKMDQKKISTDPEYEIYRDKTRSELMTNQHPDEKCINTDYEVSLEPGELPGELVVDKGRLHHVYVNTDNEVPPEGAVNTAATDIDESYLTVNTAPPDRHLTVLTNTPGEGMEERDLSAVMATSEHPYLAVLSTPEAGSHQTPGSLTTTHLTDGAYSYADGLGTLKGSPANTQTAQVQRPPLPPAPMSINPVDRDGLTATADTLLVRYVSHEAPNLPQRNQPPSPRHTDDTDKYDLVDDEYQYIDGLNKDTAGSNRITLPLPPIPVQKSSLHSRDGPVCNRRRVWVSVAILLAVCAVCVVVVVPAVILTRNKHTDSSEKASGLSTSTELTTDDYKTMSKSDIVTTRITSSGIMDGCVQCIKCAINNANGVCGFNTGSTCNGMNMCTGSADSCTCGPFGITQPYYTDCSTSGVTLPVQGWWNCSVDLPCATQCVRNYMNRYGSFCTGTPVSQISCAQYAGIHIGGPSGCNSSSTEPFRQQVSDCCLNKQC